MEKGDLHDSDGDSFCGDSEFADAIAKAAENTASPRTTSSKLRTSEISKPKRGLNSYAKHADGSCKATAYNPNHPPGGRLAPMPDNAQVLRNQSYMYMYVLGRPLPQLCKFIF